MKKIQVNLINLTNFFLISIFFFIPLFFLPQALEIFETNKLVIFYFLILLSFLIWLIRQIQKEQPALFFQKQLIILFFILILSTIFSSNFQISLLGFEKARSEGLISFFFLILFAFLLMNNFQKEKQIFKILAVFLLASFFVLLISVFQVFDLYLFPFEATRTKTFNLIANSIDSLGQFLVLSFVTNFGLLALWERISKNLFSKKTKQSLIIFFNSFLWLIFLLHLFLFFILDLKIIWLGIILSCLSFLLFFSFLLEKISLRWIIIPTILICLSCFGLILSFANLSKIEILKSPHLDLYSSWQITKENLFKDPFFGSGPSTFFYSFTKSKPVEFNESIFWNLRFFKAQNEILQILSTWGILGLISWLYLIFFFLIKGFLFLKRKKELKEEIFLIFFVLILCSFGMNLFFPSDGIDRIFFFGFLGLGMGFLVPQINQRRFPDQKKLKANFFEMFKKSGVVLILISCLFFSFFLTRFYFAELYFIKALSLKDLEKKTIYLEKAEKLFPLKAGIYFAQAQNLLFLAFEETKKESPDFSKINSLVNQATEKGKQGIKKDSQNVTSYEAMAEIYRIGGIFIKDREEKMIEFYQKALLFEPTNPFLHSKIAEIRLSQIDQPQIDLKKNLEQAEQGFKKALSLKKDFDPALQGLTQIYQLKGEEEKERKVLP